MNHSDNDTNITQQLIFKLIKDNISFNNCKECKYFHNKNNKVLCGNPTPNEDTCIIVLEHT